MREVDAGGPATRPATHDASVSRAGPTAAVAAGPFAGPFVGASRSPGQVLALQRAAGNGAVRELLAPTVRHGAVRELLAPTVQRCGDHVEPGCPCAEGHAAATGAAPGVQRDGPDAGAPQACGQVGTLRVAGSEIASLDASMKADCPQEMAWFVNRHAMFNLLPLLGGVHALGSWQTLRGYAARIGGPRLEAAMAAVELRMRGTRITGPDIRGLIDGMGPLPADQRRDILRYLGKLAVIQVGTFPVDFSYCASSSGASCEKDLALEIRMKRDAIEEYRQCKGDKSLANGAAVQAKIQAGLKGRGYNVVVAATTNLAGHVRRGTPVENTQSGPIFEHATFVVHEPYHVRSGGRLRKKGGQGNEAPEAVWDDRDDTAQDEVEATERELSFLKGVKNAIATLEGQLTRM